MGESYGPYDEYREVETSHGVFGIEPGTILTFDERGAAVRLSADQSTEVSDESVEARVAAADFDDEDAITEPDDGSDEES